MFEYTLDNGTGSCCARSTVIALTTMVSAALVEHHHWSAAQAIPVVLAIGTAFGAFMGWLIQRFRLQPFIVTLAGMFLARGLYYLISIDSISITDATYTAISQTRIPLWGSGASITVSALLALAMVAVGIWLAHATEFGRTVYAIGGSAPSALLMGLPVARTTVLVYTFSGFCSALAGVVFTFYMLDAIAAVVIGGTLLSGGVGYVVGTLFGVLILGIIQTLIAFDGSLSSWWTRIVIGALLFVFCLLQRGFESHRASWNRWGGFGPEPGGVRKDAYNARVSDRTARRRLSDGARQRQHKHELAA